MELRTSRQDIYYLDGSLRVVRVMDIGVAYRLPGFCLMARHESFRLILAGEENVARHLPLASILGLHSSDSIIHKNLKA